MSVSVREKYYELERAQRVAEDKLDTRKRRLEREAAKRIDAQLKDEREELHELRRQVYAARCAWEDELVEHARKDPSVGRVLIGWTALRCYGGGWSPNGQKGRIDVWTRESKHPENMRFGLPSPGSLYIRVLKKDGTDSLNFDTLNHSWKVKWLPPGETPAG